MRSRWSWVEMGTYEHVDGASAVDFIVELDGTAAIFGDGDIAGFGGDEREGDGLVGWVGFDFSYCEKFGWTRPGLNVSRVDDDRGSRVHDKYSRTFFMNSWRIYPAE